MSGKNLVRKEFLSDGTWTCPGGVTQIKAKVFGRLSTQIEAGAGATGHGAAVTTNGQMYAWGGNANGQIGDGTVTVKSSPVLVVGVSQRWNALGVGVDNLFGILVNGDGYGWGLNANGQLGIGSVTPQSSPILVLGGFKWQLISGGASTVGITATGIAYAWGLNANGQLGLGDVTPRSSPVIVLGGFTWRQVISARSNFMLGVATTGAAYGWGLNAFGQLGVGDVTPRSSPVIVLGGFTWASVACSSGASGGGFSIGITNTGDAYGWGANNLGQLGVGDVTPRSSPVIIVGGKKWRFIKVAGDSAIGITRDGLTYAWGRNESGQLGDGTVVSKSSPVLVLGGITFRQVIAGEVSGSNLGYMMGIATNGNAYGWGSNLNGQLGVGDVTAKSSPILIVGSNVWRAIDVALLAEQIIDVTPGITYTAVQLATVTSFGPTALFTDEFNSGSLPTRIVLEYFA